MTVGVLKPYMLLWSHLELLVRVIEMTLRQRYLGTVLGVGWHFLAPLTLIGAYAAFFICVLGVTPANLSRAEYAAHLTTGLVLYLTLSQCLTAATGALTQDPSLLFNRVFPAELFPVREVLLGAPLLAAGLLIAVVWGLVAGTFGWTWLWLPLILFLFIQAIIGCAWVLALANLITKDVAQLLSFALTLIMLTSPIAYEPEMLPPTARLLLGANPIAHFIGSVQQIVVHGASPSFGQLFGITITAIACFHIGFLLFMKGKGIIAESV